MLLNKLQISTAHKPYLQKSNVQNKCIIRYWLLRDQHYYTKPYERQKALSLTACTALKAIIFHFAGLMEPKEPLSCSRGSHIVASLIQ